MNIWVVAIVMTAIIAAAWILVDHHRVPASQSRTSVPRSPLDHAEKILASRYARREISAEEYGRMLVVLRR